MAHPAWIIELVESRNKPGKTIYSASQEFFFRGFGLGRRCAAKTARRGFDKGDEISKALRRDCLLEALRHERNAGSANLLDISPENLLLRASALNQCQGRRGFGAHDPAERSPVASFNVVSDEPGFNGGIRVKDRDDKITRCLVSQRREIR